MHIFQNYHRHSYYTNKRVSDSVTPNEAYAQRAAELGHGIISTAEHGWQGRYIEGYELAKKYGLKFVFGTEAYWVKDRFEKDRSNCHIYIGAKNENGRQAINDVLSEACLTGFYGQPRIDIPLILSLPPNDVIVTTACVAYWKYEDIESITKRFLEHFEKNFFFEVQYHNTIKQRDLNRRILALSERLKAPLIMGCDSHYILASGDAERNDFINSKGMTYSDEEGWYLDYPNGDEAYKRFADQCVLSHEQILQAMRNTNVFLEVEEYDNPCFSKDIKMPSLCMGSAQDEKDRAYSDKIWAAWETEKKNIPEGRINEYEDEIRKEEEIVHVTKHADYFLVDCAIVQKAKEDGGVITDTGRGSGVSFYTNKLLGFTDVDRIAAAVKMYPERFMSPTRILESKSLADLDLNCANPKVFAKAQEAILGEGHSYPMITYGTMKPKAAWKMYSKSQNVEFETANRISDQIGRYELALKHVNDEDERDEIDPLDYVDVEYQSIYKESVKYQGVVVSASIHPCSYLLYQGDIRKEIGLTRAKDNIVCIMDGKWAEDYKFLKNDLLKVSVVDLIDRIYKRIGREHHSIRELLNICTPDSPVWDIYKKGCTLGINQVEQDGTRQRVMKYSPKNISELCAFVAAIRPGFKSMYKIFEERKHFEYGIKALDELIQTPEMPHSFILYQEMSMAVLNYAGIPMSECYEIIKNIAKKRVGKILAYKEQFLENFAKVLTEKDGQTQEVADRTAHKIWQLLEDSSQYAFNASHSYSVALDSLYGAYLKSNHPLEFYETFLRVLEEKGDKDRMSAVRAEAENYFGIRFPPYRFGQDNRSVVANVQAKEITNTMSAIKGFGEAVGNMMYECGQLEHSSFVDVMIWLDEHGVKLSKVIPLIQIDYFMRYGNIPSLLAISAAFDYFKQGRAKSINKDKENPYEAYMPQFASDKNSKGLQLKTWAIHDCIGLLKAIEADTLNNPPQDFSYTEKANLQLELLGYIDLTTGQESDRRKVFVTDLFPLKSKESGVPWGHKVGIKSIGSGRTSSVTVYDKAYRSEPFRKGSILYASSLKKNERGYWILYDYSVIA